MANIAPTAESLVRARERLLEHYDATGVFRSELSASALSTATAAMAFALVGDGDGDASRERFARGGWNWLCRHQNADGGWGDTVDSPSNISTATLCWASLGLDTAPSSEAAAALRRAEQFITAQCGGVLAPETLAATIRARYGADHTFSVPILTACALAGRLGQDGFRHVPQLPFEMAALPHRWFRALRLRVVSYALPALIAIGQVRHQRRPTRNPITRVLRGLSRRRTLRTLAEIQPATGGYLEAAPLTSFVVMSLAAMGLGSHDVVRRGLGFLEETVRDDGSWPIDTNLDTWCTTLAVGALPELDDGRRRAVGAWLLGQQLATEHPYTHADPGGFAWTDRAGGVPDADDTAGAVLALHALAESGDTARFRDAAARGIGWLLDLQNRDGGMPTFCRGWGKLPFDRSGADLTAHAIRAFVAWHSEMPDSVQRRIDTSVARAGGYLLGTQRADGAWVPLWFGNQNEATQENPIYGTSRVLRAIAVARLAPEREPAWIVAGERGVRYLLGVQQTDGGFGSQPSIEETALAVEALAEWRIRDRSPALRQEVAGAVARGAAWLVGTTAGGSRFPPAPIGLYFARLWYSEVLYPLIFTTSALDWVGRCAAGHTACPTS